jgi:transcriptional regulator with XRE-family HTH domain
MKPKTSDPVDKHVGSRVRMRRMLLGMSQSTVAKACGITFQQVQKYESGTNRIGSSRMLQIAEALQVSPEFFFEGLPGAKKQTPVPSYVTEFLADRDGIALMKALSQIERTTLKRAIIHLVEELAAEKR